MIDFTRGISTLVGAGVAGFLLWFATQIGSDSAAEYWTFYGLIAAAGLTMALSQILGGWTKWGWPRISPGVFLLGFLPVLVVGGWVLLSRQPADFFNTSNWSRDLGIYGVVSDLGELLAAVAFGIGLTFGLIFDTSGPRHEPVARRRLEDVDSRAPMPAERTRDRDADEPLTAERSAATGSADESDDHDRGRRFGLRRVGSGSKRDES